MICLALENPNPALLAAIEQELGLSCVATQTFHELLELLIQERLTGFAVDVRMLEREPRMAELAWSYAGGALSVIVDPRHHSVEDIVRELSQALARQKRNRKQAEEEQRAKLAQRFSDPLAAMMVHLGIVLEDQKLAKVTRLRVERVLRAAENLNSMLAPPLQKPDTLPAEPPQPSRPVLVARAATAGAQS